MGKFSKIRFFLLIAWAIPISISLSLMLGLHFVPHAKTSLTGLNNNPSFIVHHFLSLECSCSRNIVKHLLERKALPHVTEIIHLIHSKKSATENLKQAGFIIKPIDEETAVAAFHLQSVPQLVVMKGINTLYQGGYGKDQQHSQVYEDIHIITQLKDKQSVSEFPLFGCANGQIRKKCSTL